MTCGGAIGPNEAENRRPANGGTEEQRDLSGLRFGSSFRAVGFGPSLPLLPCFALVLHERR